VKDKDSETDEQRIDRYFVSRWSLVESAVITDMPMRTLTSYITKQTLGITPRVWTAEELGIEAIRTTSLKPRKRAKYGFPNLLQFLVARQLFGAGVEREIVQKFIDGIARFSIVRAGTGTENKRPPSVYDGTLLILTGSSPQMGFVFENQKQLIDAIKENPRPLPQCAIFTFGSVLRETATRIEAWERRQSYVGESQGNAVSEAQRAWIDAAGERMESRFLGD
jgi:hypothetical protein